MLSLFSFVPVAMRAPSSARVRIIPSCKARFHRRSPQCRNCSNRSSFSTSSPPSTAKVREDEEAASASKARPHRWLLPKRVILLRHGESLGNVDETTYATTPDWKIGMTERGSQQARHAGGQLAELCKGEGIFVYASPYERAMQTWQVVKQELERGGDTRIIGIRQEPRLAEQQFGNFQNPNKVLAAKEERREFGRFFFRFPNGEAGLDVYNRATSFLATMSRDLKHLSDNGVDMENCNILCITHGLTLRLVLMRYFQLSVEEFEASSNPPNAKLVVLDRCFKPESTDDDTNRAARNNLDVTEDDIFCPSRGREFFRLQDSSRDLLSLTGDVSNEFPVFWRDRYNL